MIIQPKSRKYSIKLFIMNKFHLLNEFQLVFD